MVARPCPWRLWPPVRWSWLQVGRSSSAVGALPLRADATVPSCPGWLVRSRPGHGAPSRPVCATRPARTGRGPRSLALAAAAAVLLIVAAGCSGSGSDTEDSGAADPAATGEAAEATTTTSAVPPGGSEEVGISALPPAPALPEVA